MCAQIAVAYRQVYRARQAPRVVRHFGGLVASLARNGVILAFWAARARLRGRPLVVIGLAERMGDIAACQPVAREARRQSPRGIILWALRPRYADLLASCGELDGLLRVHCVTEWVVWSRLGLAGRAIDLHVHGKHCEVCRVPVRKSPPADAIDLHNYYDHGALLHAFAGSAGLSLGDEQPELVISLTAAARVDRLGLPEAFVCVHTMSEEATRNWPPERRAALINHITEELGLSVIEIGAVSRLGLAGRPGFTELCGRTDLIETAEVLRRASLFIGIDSGPAHLANAVRTPGVILLGSYRAFESYMPYTGCYADPNFCTILRHEGPVAGLPVTQCIEAVDDWLSGAASQTLPSGSHGH